MRRQLWWYFSKVLFNRGGRYWGIFDELGQFVGHSELTSLGREGEIGLIVDPNLRGGGIGRAAVQATLDKGWQLGLERIWGEVYYCNAARPFWEKLAQHTTRLENRTYYAGKYWGSTLFGWDRER
jgi:RimJ/RimL family protein N-acetyltransferase